jgi:CheY-like chemotaxis protein
LLDLAKVEAGRIEARPSRFTLDELFNALRGVLKPLLGANRTLDLVFEPVEDVPPLFTDEAKLSQILRNFVSNALKFTDRGEVRISTKLLSDGKCVRIAVTDTGIGIAKEHLDLVFEEFAQIHSPVQKKVKGTGLGLPLAKKLAGLLGGSIGVESEVGLGSTFYVDLPLLLPTVAELQPEHGAEKIAEKSVQEVSARRILIVDDNPQHRYILRAALGDASEVLEADSAHSGFAAALEHRPDLIFIDLVMEGMSGFDLIRMLEANPETRRIPRIVNSSKDLSPHERSFLEGHTGALLNKRSVSGESGKINVQRAMAKALAQSKTSA